MVRFLVVAVLLGGCTAPNPGFQSDGTGSPNDLSTRDGAGQVFDGPPILGDLPPPPPPPPADTFHCKPNSFVGCQDPHTLERCNSKGTDIILQSCFPFLCNPNYERCNQCDPTEPPACSGKNVVTCSPEGLKVVKFCPDGCEDGQCKDCEKETFYQDADKDGFGDPNIKTESCEKPPGFVENKDDCDDADPKARPNQTGFFKQATAGTNNFDYNCDNWQERQFPNAINCQLKNGICGGDGWANYVPPCGQWAPFLKCHMTTIGGKKCVPEVSINFLQQACR